MIKEIDQNEIDALIQILKVRFVKHSDRHKSIAWSDIQEKLEKCKLTNSKKLISLLEMERTGGEPDVIGKDTTTGEYIFVDCSKESPIGRRSACYDREALDTRKEHKPENNALEMAVEMGIEILSEEDYRELQKLGDFDCKTSSWIKTPNEIRKLGGALFADFRFNQVFIYHNGASSYYGARGFRGLLKV